jgi:hypothetical protein
MATELLLVLSERARENGIGTYRAYVSTDNEVVLDALGRVGAARVAGDEDEVELAIEVPADGLGDRMREALRAAAAGQLNLARRVARRLGLGDRAT